jgi:hypothetical protein
MYCWKKPTVRASPTASRPYISKHTYTTLPAFNAISLFISILTSPDLTSWWSLHHIWKYLMDGGICKWAYASGTRSSKWVDSTGHFARWKTHRNVKQYRHCRLSRREHCKHEADTQCRLLLRSGIKKSEANRNLCPQIKEEKTKL